LKGGKPNDTALPFDWLNQGAEITALAAPLRHGDLWRNHQQDSTEPAPHGLATSRWQPTHIERIRA
jgi:hypothetical protein